MVFAIVIIWKLLLLITTLQPLPFSDSFFYDGPVVNWLNGGAYANPSLALVLPISGNQVFSAYPPLYQGVLGGWMFVFGTGVASALWLHLVLFMVYGLAVLAVLRELGVAARWVNLGSLFLFGITFHDRPDSLALACGCWALYGWLRAGRAGAGSPGKAWRGLGVTLNLLALATSPQLGLAFLTWSWWLVLAQCRVLRQPVQWFALAASVVAPAVLVVGVRVGSPLLWAGFQEHMVQTPTLLGWQGENSFELLKGQVLKLARTAPGIFFAVGCLVWWGGRAGRAALALLAARDAVFLVTTILVAGCLIFAATVLLVPSVIHWLGYLQPLVVALTLSLMARGGTPTRGSPWRPRVFRLLALVVGIRAIGMSTWGVASAVDMSAAESVRRVRAAVLAAPPDSTIVLSAAYLYEANRHRAMRSLHADWLGSYRHPFNLTQRLTEIKPATLVLTQFDWHRRYEPFITELQRQTNLVAVTVTDTAGWRPPEVFPRLQKVVQHIAWAPVVVELDWKQPAGQSVREGR